MFRKKSGNLGKKQKAEVANVMGSIKRELEDTMKRSNETGTFQKVNISEDKMKE